MGPVVSDVHVPKWTLNLPRDPRDSQKERVQSCCFYHITRPITSACLNSLSATQDGLRQLKQKIRAAGWEGNESLRNRLPPATIAKIGFLAITVLGALSLAGICPDMITGVAGVGIFAGGALLYTIGHGFKAWQEMPRSKSIIVAVALTIICLLGTLAATNVYSATSFAKILLVPGGGVGLIILLALSYRCCVPRHLVRLGLSGGDVGRACQAQPRLN